jgi:hypothetical protein
MILPIIFWTKIKKEKLGKLNSDDILDLVEEYLSEKKYNYIKRKKNKIIFHNVDGIILFRLKDFLASGEIKIKEKKNELIILNGNWMFFLFAIPFLLFILLAKFKFSTIDQSDIQLIWTFFIALFIPNLLIRIAAHFYFKGKIESLINKTIQNNTLNSFKNEKK